MKENKKNILQDGLEEIVLEELRCDIEKWHSPFSRFKRWVKRI